MQVIKDPIYYFFIVPTVLLVIQLLLYAVGVKLKSGITALLSKMLEKDECLIRRPTIPERQDNQIRLLQQGDK